MTTPEQFQAWIDAPEGTRLEFKRATGGFHFEKLVDYCVAIANGGSVQDSAFIRFLERLGQERLRHFSTYDFLTLDAIARDRPLTETMRACIPGLVDAGAMESQGRGRGVRYHLSRALYASLGKPGVYTRRRGLDHETNKALLLKHLHSSHKTGAPLSELCQVLPAQSRSSVQRLLRELRSEGRVVLRGTRKAARWYPAGDKGQNESILWLKGATHDDA